MSHGGARTMDGHGPPRKETPPTSPYGSHWRTSTPSTPLGRGSVPPTPTTRMPIPKYTSIDLESELPEIFSTSLNPNLHDPDMTQFYSHPNLGRFNYPYPKGSSRRISPPPLYERSSGWTPPHSPRTPIQKKIETPIYRKQIFWVAFFVIFFFTPLLILILFRFIPDVVDELREYRVEES